MDVQSCIDAYLGLAQDIFTPRRRTMLGGAFLHKIFGSATFSGKKLEEGIKKVIRENHPLTNMTPVTRSNEGEANEASLDDEQASARGTALEDLPMLGSGRKCKV